MLGIKKTKNQYAFKSVNGCLYVIHVLQNLHVKFFVILGVRLPPPPPGMMPLRPPPGPPRMTPVTSVAVHYPSQDPTRMGAIPSAGNT